MKIKLRYDENRIGGYKITPVSDVPKTDFGFKAHRTGWDWRLAIGKLLASEQYRDWAIRKPSKSNDMIVWYFKIVSPSGEVKYLKLTNERDYATRCVVYGGVGDAVRGQRLYEFLKKELQNTVPIEFMALYRTNRGIGIENRDGELTTVAKESSETWTDQLVSRLVW